MTLSLERQTCAPPYETQPIEHHPIPLPWYVLRVETGRELVINEHLSWLGITSSVPSYTFVRRLPKTKPVTVTRALYAGYVFAQAAPIDRRILLQSPGVYELLQFGGRPALIDPDEMERIVAISTQRSVEPWQNLREGDPVRVIDGPLQGIEGRLLRCGDNFRFIVAIEMLRRAVSVTVDGWTVQAA